MAFRAQISTSPIGLEVPDTTLAQYALRRLRSKQSDAAENQDALVNQHSFLSYSLDTLGSAAKWGGEKSRRGVEICIGTMPEPGGILKKGRNFDSGGISSFNAVVRVFGEASTYLHGLNQFIIV